MPYRLGPKRANKIRALFNLTKDDDVRKYIISRTFTSKKGKEVRRAPKIQRLVAPLVLQRKRARKAAKLASVLRKQGGRGRVHEACGAAPHGAEGGKEEFDQQEEEHAQVPEGGGNRLSLREGRTWRD